MMYFYALYSRSSKTFNTPFLAHDDEEAKRIIEKTVTLQNDMALIYSLDDLQIERVGRFDPSNPCCPVQQNPDVETALVTEDLVNDLHYPPMIKSMITKLYERKDTDDGSK